MVISTDDGAGEIVAAGEDTRFYDDIGCMAADWAAHRDATAFVHARGGVWMNAAAAAYARPAAARTAMGSGVVAFATAADAGAADPGGRALTWDEVVAFAGGRP